MFRLTATICTIVLMLPLAAHAQDGTGRLLKGEIQYESLQGNHLDALLRYDAHTASIEQLPASSQPSAADLRLALGLSSAVEKNIKTRSADKVTQETKNRDAYRLAWFYYNNRKPVQAIEALDSIKGKADGVSLSDIEYLRALAYLKVGRFKAAADLLHELPLIDRPRGYTLYNLAMAQLQGGNEERGRSTLASLGRINTSDADLLALKDMANIKLGYRYLQEGSLEQAKASFSRARLDGPFTSQALLGSGWTSFSMGQIERAIVAWSLLHEQEVINDAVIEAKMALPYAYSKLDAHGKAANLYAHTVELFESEIARLDASSDAIRKGELSRAIISHASTRAEDWHVSLSGRNEQALVYLPLLLADDEFRDQADRLRQLAQLSRRIELELSSIPASIEFASLKRKHFKTALPAAEKDLSAIYQEMKKIIPAGSPPADSQNKTINKIPEVILLQQTYDNYLKARKASADYNQQLPEYIRELSVLSKKLKRHNQQLDRAIAITGKQVDALALAALDQKRNRLKSYYHDALFALAESYDFATGKKQ